MSHRHIALAVFGLMFVAAATMFADWDSFKSSQMRSESAKPTRVITTGRFEKAVFMDGSSYDPRRLDGVRDVEIYEHVIIVRKPGRTGAAVIPMQNLKYFVLD